MKNFIPDPDSDQTAALAKLEKLIETIDFVEIDLEAMCDLALWDHGIRYLGFTRSSRVRAFLRGKGLEELANELPDQRIAELRGQIQDDELRETVEALASMAEKIAARELAKEKGIEWVGVNDGPSLPTA